MEIQRKIYSKEKHRNDIEIDFLLSNEHKTNFKMITIEIKSAKKIRPYLWTDLKNSIRRK